MKRINYRRFLACLSKARTRFLKGSAASRARLAEDLNMVFRVFVGYLVLSYPMGREFWTQLAQVAGVDASLPAVSWPIWGMVAFGALALRVIVWRLESKG